MEPNNLPIFALSLLSKVVEEGVVTTGVLTIGLGVTTTVGALAGTDAIGDVRFSKLVKGNNVRLERRLILLFFFGQLVGTT